MARLLILDPSSPDAGDAMSAATLLGDEVYTCSPPPGVRLPVVPGVAHDVVIDFSDVESALASVIAYAIRQRIHGIMTTSEFLTPIVTRACAALSLPGNRADLALAPRSKVAMSDRFRQCGVSMPATFAVAEAAELDEILSSGRLSYPVVVKAAENAGKKGVTVISSANQLPAALARVAGQEDTYGMPLDRRVVVQEYVPGDEYSVESVTQDGVSRHACITRKLTTAGEFRVETGHVLPARPGSLAAERRILGEVSKALRATGIRNCVSHTEIKVRPDGSCAVIEVAARIGGGRIGQLAQLALGISLAAAAINIALGRPADVRPRGAGYAMSCMILSPAPGRLVAVNNLPMLANGVAAVGLTRKIGSLVTGPETNKGRVGYFILVGEDGVALRRRAAALIEQVEVIVEPV